MTIKKTVLDASFCKEVTESFHALGVENFTYSWSPVTHDIVVEIGFEFPEAAMDSAALALLHRNIRRMVMKRPRLDTNKRFCKIMKVNPGKVGIIEHPLESDRNVRVMH